MVENLFLERIIRTLFWCRNLDEGEMIEVPKDGYCRTHLGFDTISQVELDAICTLVNPILERAGRSFRLTNDMGEIIPFYIISRKG